jgi:hypothetical protein
MVATMSHALETDRRWASSWGEVALLIFVAYTRPTIPGIKHRKREITPQAISPPVLVVG